MYRGAVARTRPYTTVSLPLELRRRMEKAKRRGESLPGLIARALDALTERRHWCSAQNRILTFRTADEEKAHRSVFHFH